MVLNFFIFYIKQIIYFLFKIGLQTVGLFRVGVSKKRLKEVIQLIKIFIK